MTKGPLLSDLDGTIVDTAPAIFECLHLVCAVFDIELASDADLSWCLGPPLHYCLTGLGIDEARMRDAVAVFETAHTERIDLCTPMPGAEIVIPALASQGIKIGVATIKPEPIALLVLDSLGLLVHIAGIHARADDRDPRDKTDLVRACIDDPALAGDSPLYVGDHDGDEAAAAALNIPFLRYPDHHWDVIGKKVLA